jgi:hypothetical protein
MFADRRTVCGWVSQVEFTARQRVPYKIGPLDHCVRAMRPKPYRVKIYDLARIILSDVVYADNHDEAVKKATDLATGPQVTEVWLGDELVDRFAAPVQ